MDATNAAKDVDVKSSSLTTVTSSATFTFNNAPTIQTSTSSVGLVLATKSGPKPTPMPAAPTIANVNTLTSTMVKHNNTNGEQQSNNSVVLASKTFESNTVSIAPVSTNVPQIVVAKKNVTKAAKKAHNNSNNNTTVKTANKPAGGPAKATKTQPKPMPALSSTPPKKDTLKVVMPSTSIVTNHGLVNGGPMNGDAHDSLNHAKTNVPSSSSASTSNPFEQPITILNIRTGPKGQIVPALVNQSVLGDGNTPRPATVMVTTNTNGSGSQLTPLNIGAMQAGTGTLTLPILSNGNAISFPGPFAILNANPSQQQQSSNQQNQQVQSTITTVSKGSAVVPSAQLVGGVKTLTTGHVAHPTLLNMSNTANLTQANANCTKIIPNGQHPTSQTHLSLTSQLSTQSSPIQHQTTVVGTQQHQHQQQPHPNQTQIFPISTVVNNGNKIAMLVLTPNVPSNAQNSSGNTNAINSSQATLTAALNAATNGGHQQFFLRTNGGQANQIFAVTAGPSTGGATVTCTPGPIQNPAVKAQVMGGQATSVEIASNTVEAVNSAINDSKATCNKKTKASNSKTVKTNSKAKATKQTKQTTNVGPTVNNSIAVMSQSNSAPTQVQSKAPLIAAPTATGQGGPKVTAIVSSIPAPLAPQPSTSTTDVNVTNSRVVNTNTGNGSGIALKPAILNQSGTFTKFITLSNNQYIGVQGKKLTNDKSSLIENQILKVNKPPKPKRCQVDAATQTDSFLADGNQLSDGTDFQLMLDRLTNPDTESCQQDLSKTDIKIEASPSNEESSNIETNNSAESMDYSANHGIYGMEEFLTPPPEASQVMISGRDPNLNTTISHSSSSSNSVSNTAVRQQYRSENAALSSANMISFPNSNTNQIFIRTNNTTQRSLPNGRRMLSNMMISSTDPLLSDNSPPSPMGAHVSNDSSYVSHDSSSVEAQSNNSTGGMFSNFLSEMHNSEQREDYTIDGLDMLTSLIDNDALNNRADFPINDLNLVNHVLSGLETERPGSLKRSYTDPGIIDIPNRRTRLSQDDQLGNSPNNTRSALMHDINTNSTMNSASNTTINNNRGSVLMSILTSPAINRTNASSVAATQQIIDAITTQKPIINNTNSNNNINNNNSSSNNNNNNNINNNNNPAEPQVNGQLAQIVNHTGKTNSNSNNTNNNNNTARRTTAAPVIARKSRAKKALPLDADNKDITDNRNSTPTFGQNANVILNTELL